jgi:hypothetical protein
MHVENANHLIKDCYLSLDAAVRIVGEALAEGRALSDAERVECIRERSEGVRLLRKAERIQQRFARAGVDIARELPEAEYPLDPAPLADRLAVLERTSTRIRAGATAERRDLNPGEIKDLAGLSGKIDDLERSIAIVDQLRPFYAE